MYVCFECRQNGSADAARTDRSRRQEVLKELQLLRIKYCGIHERFLPSLAFGYCLVLVVSV